MEYFVSIERGMKSLSPLEKLLSKGIQKEAYCFARSSEFAEIQAQTN